MNPGCEICKVLDDSKTDIVVFATKHWRVVLAPDQDYLGRAWVTLRTHVGSLPELSQEQWLELHEAMGRYEAMCREAFNATLFNWTCLMNLAYRESNPAPHVHWHVRPRYAAVPRVGDEEFPDPNFGNHYNSKVARVVELTRLQEIAARLRAGASV